MRQEARMALCTKQTIYKLASTYRFAPGNSKVAVDILRAWQIVVPARSTLEELVASITPGSWFSRFLSIRRPIRCLSPGLAEFTLPVCWTSKVSIVVA